MVGSVKAMVAFAPVISRLELPVPVSESTIAHP